HWRTEDDPLPFARIAAEISTGNAYHRLEVTLVLEGQGNATRFKKVIKQNGVEKRVMDVIGLLNVVLFVPQDLSLIEGSPSHRRQFMNVTLSQVDRAYYEALDKYEKLLPQRNALLRSIADRRASDKELAYWDAQLIEAGSILISRRQGFLRELE